MDPCDNMNWFPENQCNDPCATMNCCTTTDLCEQIDINQEPKIGSDGFKVWLDVANFM